MLEPEVWKTRPLCDVVWMLVGLFTISFGVASIAVILAQL